MPLQCWLQPENSLLSRGFVRVWEMCFLQQNQPEPKQNTTEDITAARSETLEATSKLDLMLTLKINKFSSPQLHV